jgi:hypothetical protein
MALDIADQARGAYHSLAEAEPRLARDLLAAVENVLARLGGKERSVFNLDVLHSWLSYRNEKRFYIDLLQHGMAQIDSFSPYAVKCASYYAEVLRRARQYEESRQLFQKILPAQERRQSWADVSRTWYGLGYINFMQGEMNPAAEAFIKSVFYAEKAPDAVGAAIGRCLQYQALYLHAVSEATRGAFRSALLEGKRVFQAHTRPPYADHRAERWVMNTCAHLFQIAHEEDNLTQATLMLNALEVDPWVLSFPDRIPVQVYGGCHLLLQGNCAAAVKRFHESQQSEKDSWKSDREGAARAWFYLGLAHQGCHNASEALEAWHKGLCCIDDGANRVWKERIRDALSRR